MQGFFMAFFTKISTANINKKYAYFNKIHTYFDFSLMKVVKADRIIQLLSSPKSSLKYKWDGNKSHE